MAVSIASAATAGSWVGAVALAGGKLHAATACSAPPTKVGCTLLESANANKSSAIGFATVDEALPANSRATGSAVLASTINDPESPSALNPALSTITSSLIGLRESGRGTARGIFHLEMVVSIPVMASQVRPVDRPLFATASLSVAATPEPAAVRRYPAECRLLRSPRAGSIAPVGSTAPLTTCAIAASAVAVGLACRLTNCERFATVLVPVLAQVLGAGLSPSPGWMIASPTVAPSLRAKTWLLLRMY